MGMLTRFASWIHLVASVNVKHGYGQGLKRNTAPVPEELGIIYACDCDNLFHRRGVLELDVHHFHGGMSFIL
jgi:hypothetical protein